MNAQSGWSHNNAEAYQDWEIVNNSSVNPVPAGLTPINYTPVGMTMYSLGPDFAGWLAKRAFPIIPLSSGILTCSDDIWASYDALNGQAWEFDERLTDAAGNVLACDCNFNLAEGGVIQSVKATGAGWDDTPFKPGPPPAGVWTTLTRVYAFDNGVCRMVSAALGSQSTGISSAVSVPALPLKWGPNLLVKQRQIDENAQGQAFGLMIRNSNCSAVGSL